MPRHGFGGPLQIKLYGERAGIVAVIDGDDLLEVARSLYWRAIMNRPNRLGMLCDRARIIAGSDQLETMPTLGRRTAEVASTRDARRPHITRDDFRLRMRSCLTSSTAC